MKKIIRIILSAFLVTGVLCGCVKEEKFGNENNDTPVDGNTVVIDGSLNLPAVMDGAWTKAFTEVPAVKRLYLAVFNQGDILYEIVQAKPGTQSHPTNPAAGFSCGDASSNYLTQFHVELSTADNKRYIHFIATSAPIPELEESTINMMDEGTFVRNLVTSDAVVAYWGREEFLSIAGSTKMNGIKMIRNFAKVKVAEEADNFELLGFKVFDTPVYGTIAPFNNNTSDYINVDGNDQINFNRFANYKTAATQSESPYSYLNTTTNYHGFMPPVVEYNDLHEYYDAAGTDNVPWISPSGVDYLYECSYRPDRNPFIILKARFNNTLYYYKADFVYETPQGKEYYNLLRNFQFTLNITAVNGKGSNTVYDAVNSIALNNFEGSTMAQELTNIANDNSRLYVSKTDVLLTSGTTYTMYVKSRTGNSFTTNDNASIKVHVQDATSGNNIIADSTAVSIANSDTSIDGDNWRKVTITIADADNLQRGEVWKQAIVFKNGDGLTRTVNFTLRRPMSLTVDMQDVVPGVKDTECELKFSIPSGFTAYRFPMYFYIEQEENNLYPKALPDGAYETLTVMTGNTNIPDRSGHAYYYRRAISWEEYEAASEDIYGIKTFSCYFKTLNPESATSVWVVPAPESNYFYPYDEVENKWTNCDAFLNNKIAGTVTFPFYGLQLAVGGSQTVPASTNSDGTITYSSSNTSVATVDATGKVSANSAGTAIITATVSETGSYTSGSNSYTVSVTAGDVCNLTMDWRYEPVYVVRNSASVHSPIADATVASGYSVEVTYTTSSTDGASVSVDETNADSNGYVTITGNAVGTVTVTATATVKDSGNNVIMTRVMSYDMHVVAVHPESGTVYHNEDFLGPDFGDYSIISEVITDGATYTAGSDVSALFAQYTTYNAGTGYDPRQVWYPYYNKSTKSGFGVAASGYGSTEEATSSIVDGNTVWDYHNRSYASHSQLASKNIDLSCSAGVNLTFYHCGEYFYNTETYDDIDNAQNIMKGDVSVKISKNGGSTWENANVKFWPAGSNWVYIRTSVDVPADYLTSQFRIMFDYTSTNTRAGTWEIKNLQISEK